MNEICDKAITSFPTRHKSLDDLIEIIHQIVYKHGGSIFDHRCGKTWDVGQAVCAELYGVDWMNSSDFERDDAIPADKPIRVEMVEAAKRVLAGADWMKAKVKNERD